MTVAVQVFINFLTASSLTNRAPKSKLCMAIYLYSTPSNIVTALGQRIGITLKPRNN